MFLLYFFSLHLSFEYNQFFSGPGREGTNVYAYSGKDPYKSEFSQWSKRNHTFPVKLPYTAKTNQWNVSEAGIAESTLP